MAYAFQPGPVDPTLVRPADDRPAPVASGPVPGEVTVPVEPLGEAAAGLQPRSSVRSPWGRVFWLLVILIIAFLGYDVGRRLTAVWHDDPLGGAVLSALALAFLVALVVAVIAEIRALHRLREVGHFRSELEAALTQDSYRRVSSALGPVLTLLQARRPDLVRDFHRRAEGQTDCSALVKQFRGAVLTPLDQEARRAVRVNALAVLGATAISPHPALDVAIVVWRSAAIVRRVADIYGLRPSGLITIRLTRMVVLSAATAMIADPTGEALTEALGGGLAEKLSGRVAEGSVSGLRALRLGVRAIEVCRPLPFEPEERNGLLVTLMQG